jgi:hypothetical protein
MEKYGIETEEFQAGNDLMEERLMAQNLVNPIDGVNNSAGTT